MNSEYEKFAADQKQAAYQSQTCSAGLGIPDEGCRISLWEQVMSRQYRAEKSAREAAQLHRLQELLERHKDIAEILELIRGLNL